MFLCAGGGEGGRSNTDQGQCGQQGRFHDVPPF
jgi:hypothetical protein